MRAPDIEHVKIKHGRCSFCGHHGDDCTGERYPEHARLKSISEYSQQIGAFLDWMAEDGVVLSREHEHSDGCWESGSRVCGVSKGELAFDYAPTTQRLGRYFEIDEDKIEIEKREMLAEIRTASATRKVRAELGLGI